MDILNFGHYYKKKLTIILKYLMPVFQIYIHIILKYLTRIIEWYFLLNINKDILVNLTCILHKIVEISCI